MMKRNWKTIGVTALCAAMLLAGCGARNDGEDQNGGVDTPDNVDNGANRAAPIERPLCSTRCVRPTTRAHCSKSTTP